MIRSWMHPEAFLGVQKDLMETPIVRDYFTGKEMDARHAIWVAGSDIVGPMALHLFHCAIRKISKRSCGAMVVQRPSGSRT